MRGCTQCAAHGVYLQDTMNPNLPCPPPALFAAAPKSIQPAPAKTSVKAAASRYFRLVVRDAETGRGVPLAELRTVNDVRFYTDSNGVAAIGDPELMGQSVYFRVSSPGYSYPTDQFGNTGTALTITPGGLGTVTLHRTNIAERLYRVTGAGIYRDSILTGLPAPIKNPLLNAQVFGQDTVMATPYRGKIVWLYGDTNRPSYPLGLFATSGATSLPPGRGGLSPSVGIDLTYWAGKDGFSRPMIPIPNAPGPVWVGGLFTITENGQERLLTHYAEIGKDGKTVVSGLAQLNDDKAVFEPVCTYPAGDPLHPEGHPFLVREQGRDYVYFETQQMGAFPLVRNTPELAHLKDPKTYESFTCLKPGGRYQDADTPLDRDTQGKLIWAWKADTAALGEDEAAHLISLGKMKPGEELTRLRDIETDATVTSHGGSVYWNPYRKRWILITTQVYGSPSFLGEVWFAEADTPVGPWLYARRIATHNGYTFYNPTQEPFFDEDGGRQIYFEGTYVDTYSGVKDLTPRYNYNQLLYRLALDDPRLSLPVPVYAVTGTGGAVAYKTREQIAPAGDWAKVPAIPFYAVPSSRPHPGLVPIGEKSVCYGLPAAVGASEKPSPSVVPLYDYRDAQGRHTYSTDPDMPLSSGRRSPLPLCRVWRNPSSALALDYEAAPGR